MASTLSPLLGSTPHFLDHYLQNETELGPFFPALNSHSVHVCPLAFSASKKLTRKFFPPVFFPLKIHLFQKVCAQMHPILCDPMDCSPSGSSVHGILPARILE